MSKAIRNVFFLIILFLSVFMHFKNFSKELIGIHAWRQTETQSTINNFYKEDMNIFNPRRNERGNTNGVFRMEFPLMQWIVACSCKLFGPHLIISRIIMFIIGLLSVLGIYKLLFALFQNQILSVIGAWAFNFSPSFYYYTINPLPDNMALCFSIWGLCLFFMWYNKPKTIHLILSGLLLSLGALCKLPFIGFFIVPLIYFTRELIKSKFNSRVLGQSIEMMGFCLLPAVWYLSVIPGWKGNIIVKGILGNSNPQSKILEYSQHILFSTLPELLLNYGSVVFFLAGFYFFFKRKAFRDSKFSLILSLSFIVMVYYIFEINAIAKIHDYYLFPFYPLLFILVGYGAYYLVSSKYAYLRYSTYILLLLLPLFCYLRMQGRWNEKNPGFNKDLLTYKLELRNAVPDDALVIAGNDESHFIFLYYIDKKGWGVQNDNLTVQNLKIMIGQGARYIYSDSRKIDDKPELNCYFEKLLLEKGSIKVYRLKH
jgi:hypothetical protein